MKLKLIFAIFTFTILYCKVVPCQTYGKNMSEEKTNGIKARLILCSGLSDKNIPLDDLKEIKVKENEKIFFYVKWFNLDKKNYSTSIDILDTDDNYLVQTSEYKFKAKKKTHNT